MNKISMSQKGSAHIVIIIVLVVLILAGLAYVLWQRLSPQNAPASEDKKTEQTVSTSQQSLVAKSVVGGQSITLNYPDTWSIKTEGDDSDGSILTTTLTSSDKKVVVTLDHSKGFYGDGTCGNSDVIVQLDTSNVTAIDKLKVVSLIYTFPQVGFPGTDDYQPQSFGYMAEVERADMAATAKLGGSICSLYQANLFGGTFTDFTYGKPAARVKIALPTLLDENRQVKSDVGVADIKAQMELGSFKEAIQILQSLTVDN